MGLELPLVLIAEDNSELRRYISSHLESDLRICQAENGRTALELARRKKPDLIVSDLMMPEMDGGELVEHLRNDEHTCHIPLIMLTARADMESRLDCFEKGSDDFLEKPFKIEELRVRIRRLIEERRNLKEYYLELFRTEASTFQPASSKEEFPARLEEYIGKRLSDPELDVDALCQHMRVSRAQLYRKVHHHTGMSPKELIRNTRLAAAARLFRQGYDNVTRVMLEVGFQSNSSFSSSFRKLHGCNPSDYIKENRVEK